MLSSTSSSSGDSGAAAWRASLVFLTLTGLWFVACETAARVGVHRISKIERGVHADIQGAGAVQRTPGGPKQLLAVGNSLLENALDREAFAAGLAPEAKSTVVVVHQTTYHDWYFGIRKLRASGANPDAILLMLSSEQLVLDSLRGDYTAAWLMRPIDVFEAGQTLDLHPTVQSGLLFSTFSKFLGLRTEIRKAALARALPPVPVLLNKIAPAGPKGLDLEVLEIKGSERLAALNKELAGDGIQFIFVVHPSQTLEEIEVYQRISRAIGVPILIPVGRPGELGPDDFMADAFHLNVSGQRKLTAALAPAVRQILTK